METKRCPHCGATVKKENLQGHLAKVHPSRFTSSTKTPTVMKTGSVFRSHRKRNVGFVVGIAMLSIVIIAVGLTASNSMSGMSSNPGPSPAGSQAAFAYLSQSDTRCSWTRSMIMSMSDSTYLQGACCNGMVFTDYQKQISELSNYSSLSSLIAPDPFNIPVKVARADFAGLDLAMSPSQQSTFDQVPTLSSEKWCCCQCWAWDQHEGLGKILIVNYGYSAQQVAHVVDLEACCGTAPGTMNMN